MQYRWGNAIEGFDMPIRVSINGESTWLSPNSKWQKLSLESKNNKVKIDANFYVSSLNILGD